MDGSEVRIIRFIQGMVKEIIADVRNDFKEPLYYIPYYPKTIGDKIRRTKNEE